MPLPDRIRARVLELRRKPIPLSEMIPLLLEAADSLEQQRDELQLAAGALSRMRGLLSQSRPSVCRELLQLEVSLQGISSTPRWDHPLTQQIKLHELVHHIDAALAEIPDRRKPTTHEVQKTDTDRPTARVQDPWGGVF